jgi:uncharacterized protein (TIGR03435 family)
VVTWLVSTMWAPRALATSPDAEFEIAQSSAASQLPAFGVTSVKPNKSGGGGTFINFQPSGRFTGTNITLRALIRVAYGTTQPLPDSQISGGPDWLDSDRFDIEAKTDTEPPRDAQGAPRHMMLMLRALLADRFRLVVRNETRERPIYALVVSENDGRLGPKLRRVGVDCAAVRAGRVAAPPATPANAVPKPLCGGMKGGPGKLAGTGTLPEIATILSKWLDREVFDQTDLIGYFELELDWAPLQTQAGAGGPETGSRPGDSGPGIFTAIQEQLGLKLRPTRGPVDVLVIDQAEQPSPD